MLEPLPLSSLYHTLHHHHHHLTPHEQLSVISGTASGKRGQSHHESTPTVTLSLISLALAYLHIVRGVAHCLVASHSLYLNSAGMPKVTPSPLHWLSSRPHLHAQFHALPSPAGECLLLPASKNSDRSHTCCEALPPMDGSRVHTQESFCICEFLCHNKLKAMYKCDGVNIDSLSSCLLFTDAAAIIKQFHCTDLFPRAMVLVYAV